MAHALNRLVGRCLSLTPLTAGAVPRLAAWRARRRADALYAKYRDATKLQAWSYRDNLQLCALVQSVPGCVVECGVWRGGMAAGLVEWLGGTRRYYLLDSFEGLPAPAAVDGDFSRAVQTHPDWDNCAATLAEAHATLARAGTASVTYVRGWFKDTIPGLALPEPIALLRLDADWYDSTMQCLDGLYDLVAPGGLILIDDYHFWEGCTRAVHDFLSKRQLVARLRESPHGVAYIVKDADRRR
jgi:O-methyltransferase